MGQVMSQLVAGGALRGVIHELQGTGVRRAWRRWRGVATTEHQRRSSLRRGAMAIKHRELRMSLNGWIEGAEIRRLRSSSWVARGAPAARPPTAMNGRRRGVRRASVRIGWRARGAMSAEGARSGVPSNWAPLAYARVALRRGAMAIKNREVDGDQQLGRHRRRTRRGTRLVRRATAGIRHRGLRLAVNGWVEAARLGGGGCCSASCRRARAVRRAYNCWGARALTLAAAELKKRRAVGAMRHRAARAALLTARAGASGVCARRVSHASSMLCRPRARAPPRPQQLAWVGRAACAAATRRRGDRKPRAAHRTNGWAEAAAELGQRRRLLRSFASPEGRAMRRGLNRWVEVARRWRRRAARSAA